MSQNSTSIISHIFKKAMFLIAVAFFSVGVVSATQMGVSGKLEGFDLVMVCDQSSSMREVDSDYRAKNAFAMFLDTLYIDSQNRSAMPDATVGLIAYNDEVTTVARITHMDSEAAVGQMRESIYRLTYSDTKGDSGLGTALLEAVNMLEPFKAEVNRQKIILLFTDGYTGVLSDSTSQEDDKMPFFGGVVQSDLEKAIKRAQQLQCQIIVLGLENETLLSQWDEYRKIANYLQSVALWTYAPNEPDAQLPSVPPPLSAWSSGIFLRDADDPFLGGSDRPPTGGPPTGYFGANYYRAQDLMDVEQFYMNFSSAVISGSSPVMLKQHIPSDGISQYRLLIDAPGNTAAIFYIFAHATTNRLSLTNPDGKTIQLNSIDADGWTPDRTVRLRWWQGYITLTLLDPVPGTWLLQADGDVEVHYTLIGGLNVTLSIEHLPNTNLGRLTAQAMYHNLPMDRSFYSLASCECVVANVQSLPPLSPEINSEVSGLPTTPEFELVELSFNESKQALIGDFPISTSGLYLVNLRLSASGVDYYVTQSIELTYEPIIDGPLSPPPDLPYASVPMTTVLLLLLLSVLFVTAISVAVIWTLLHRKKR